MIWLLSGAPEMEDGGGRWLWLLGCAGVTTAAVNTAVVVVVVEAVAIVRGKVMSAVAAEVMCRDAVSGV